MNVTTRRAMLHLLAGAAIASPLRACPVAASSGPIHPPTTPMTFRRTLVREMVGGARITVRREFTIRFEQFADGYRIAGEHAGVDIEMPEELAEFAQIERTRIDQTFPLVIGPTGFIAAPDGSAPPGTVVQRAFDAAFASLDRQSLSADDRAVLRSHIDAIHKAGGIVLAQMPGDLFAPVEEQRSEEQRIPLPDGSLGRLSSTFTAQRDCDTGLMREASREILTEIDGDRRVTREIWQLASR